MNTPTLEQTVERIVTSVASAMNHPSIAMDVPDALWPWLRGADDDGVPFVARDILAVRPAALAAIGAKRLGLRDPAEMSDDYYGDLDATRLALVATLGVAALAEERRALEDRCPRLSVLILQDFDVRDDVGWYAGLMKCDRKWLPVKTEIRNMDRAAQQIVADALASKLSGGVNDLVKHPKRKVPRYPVLR